MRPTDGEPTSNEELLVALRADPEALAVLYTRCVPVTVAFATRRCGSPEQVHDLVAAIWLEVIDASERFDPSRGRAVPYILGIATNLVADDRRRRAREHEALRRLAGRRTLHADDVERLLEAIDAARSIPSVLVGIQELPADERQAIELLVDGLSQSEAAEVAGVTPATFRMRLSRARQRLRRSQHGERTTPMEVSGP
jgi:RNA polymerase sigma-70 factor (ECF subfamily)